MNTETKSDSSDSRSEKPKIIRNREVDRAARALAEDHVLPEVPGTRLSWNQMQDYLALLTPAMWSHVSIYVYRLKPKIRRQLRDPGLPNYIDCYGEPFTLEYFTARHGGGKYMLQTNDMDRKGQERDAKTIFTCTLDIDEVKYPPILDYSELELEARENQSYITWLSNKGILDAKGNVVQGNSTSTNNGPAFKDVV